MVCPKCKAFNPNDFRFCRKCHNPLDLAAVAAEKAQEEVKPEEPVPPPGGIAAGSATANSAARVTAAGTSAVPVTETSAPEMTAHEAPGSPLKGEESHP